MTVVLSRRELEEELRFVAKHQEWRFNLEGCTPTHDALDLRLRKRPKSPGILRDLPDRTLRYRDVEEVIRALPNCPVFYRERCEYEFSR